MFRVEYSFKDVLYKLIIVNKKRSHLFMNTIFLLVFIEFWFIKEYYVPRGT